MYYKRTNGETCISSIGENEFCQIIGDGKSSFESLLKKNIGARNRMEGFKAKFKSYRNKIIAKGVLVLLEPIGNHNRVPHFLIQDTKSQNTSWNVLRNGQMRSQILIMIDLILRLITRMSLNKKKIKIIEVIGVNSEPIHNYDPNYNIFKAYKDLFFYMKITQQIAFQKMKNNAFPTFLEFYNQTITYYFKKTKRPKCKLNTRQSY